MNKTAVLSCITCLLLFAMPASSQTISILEEFEYGGLVILNNNQPRDFRITPNGGPRFNSNHFVSFGNPNRARIRLFDFPANSSFSVSVSATPISSLDGARSFTVSDVQVRPNTLSTNGRGRDTVRFGTTIQTDGTGVPYPDGPYTGSIQITVIF
jgi:hypothetical protein